MPCQFERAYFDFSLNETESKMVNIVLMGNTLEGVPSMQVTE